jgi:glutaredoxin
MWLLCALLASSPALTSARRDLARGQLEETLFDLRPKKVPAAEVAQAADLLTDAAQAAQARKKLDLAQELLDEGFQLDPTHPRVLELEASWALADGHGAMARRYAEIWAKTHPSDARAQEFRRYVIGASEHLQPRAQPPVEAAPARRSQEIVLYGTSWCGVCRRARGYLMARGLKFKDKDIEKDLGAAVELSNKERAAGFRHTGVPVLDVHGKLMEGFSARAIDDALRD